jgi:catechol 2,3-dioxygenase
MSEPIHPEVRIGHAHLKVADLARATAFYRDVLGFGVMMQMGAEAAILSAGGYHHHIGLHTWHNACGTPPPEGHTGLFHVAILYHDRRELANAVKRMLDHGHTFTGGATGSAS